MKVCFLNHTLDEATGAGHFCRSLLASLRRAEPRLEYLVLTSVSSGAPDELAILPSGRFGFIRALPKIRAICKRYDIIHALDGYPFGVMAAVAAFGLRKRLLITAIGSGAIQPLGRPVAGRLLAWAYRGADHVVAVSGYTQRELTRRMPDLPTSVINHGVDAEEFRADAGARYPEVESLRPYVFSLGAFKPRKGFLYSLRAFAELRKRFPHLTYVIVGGGERGEFDAEIKRLGIGSSVRFFSGVPRPFLRALYRRAELFWLLPYDADGDVEGFGLVFLEAAAAGLPVIGTFESGAEDAVADGENGFLVLPRDPASAAHAAADILSSPELRERFCRGSAALAARMSWERAARAYLDLYRELLNR
jgi:glycosyltransferase involved in cell wall biosynthesis